MDNAPEHPPGGAINCAVFSNGDNFVLVHLEADTGESAAAGVVGRGYRYAGVVGVNNGFPSVQCEPGFEATLVCAGVAFAARLGALLKQQQLEQAASRPQGEKAGC